MTRAYDAPMLDRLMDEARVRAEALAGEYARFQRECAGLPPARDLAAALRAPGLSVIAEVKRRSPSAGDIAPGLDPAALSASYARGGAAAISVLTEPAHFGALPDDLERARAAVAIPVLRKDFVVDPVQLWEARATGADGVLLIVAALDDAELSSLLSVTEAAGLAALVEAHTAEEVRRAVEAGSSIVGVNNRDLTTMEVDPATAERLRPLIPEGAIAVAESGLASAEAAGLMADAGYDAILVGEAAARASDPAAFVASLLGRP